MRLRARRHGGCKNKPKRRNVALEEYRLAERDIYSDPSVARILRGLGKNNPAKPLALIRAVSVECDRNFIEFYGDRL